MEKYRSDLITTWPSGHKFLLGCSIKSNCIKLMEWLFKTGLKNCSGVGILIH